MSLSGTKCSRLILILCNVLFSWISGGLLVLFGGASLYDPSYVHIYTLLSVDTLPQYIFIIFALSIIALGGFVITLGLFGCLGTLCDNHCIIKTYVYLLVLVFLTEIGLAVGSLYLYFTFHQISPEIHSTLVVKLKDNFGSQEFHAFNSALHYTQADLRCCGVDNYTDYDMSNWRGINLDLSVPATCCSQTPISASYATTMSPKGTIMELVEDEYEDRKVVEEGSTESSSTESSWFKRCQSLNPMESDDFLYAQGCWRQLEEIYMRHALFSAILFASLALLQMLGVIFPICWLRRVEEKSRVRIRTTRQTQPLL